MKKLMAVVLTTGIVLSLAACGSNSNAPAATPSAQSPAASKAEQSSAASEEESWTFERNIEIVCPWGAGGGADTTLRTFAAALEKEIGVKVVINNKAGAGGTTGVEYAMQQPADGYTWLLCTQSPLLAQLTGASNVDMAGIEPVVRLVHDTNVIVTGKDSPYNNYKELVDYINANPGVVKAGCMTITGLDGLDVQLAFDGKVEPIAYSEGAQLNSDVMAGHIALASVGPAEIEALVASGDVKPILVCSEERMSTESFKDCECAGELGIDCYYGPYRGIFAAKGTPQAAIKAFEAAAEKAVASDTFQKWAASQGLDQRPGWQNTADFTATWNQDVENLSALVSTMNAAK